MYFGSPKVPKGLAHSFEIVEQNQYRLKDNKLPAECSLLRHERNAVIKKQTRMKLNFILVVLLICFIKSADARPAIILEMGVY